jgi:hypothetical protein
MYTFSGDSVSQAAAAKVMAEEMRARGAQAAAQAQAAGAIGAAHEDAQGVQNAQLFQQPGLFAKLLTDMYREYNNRPQQPQQQLSGLMAADANTSPDTRISTFAVPPKSGFDGDPSKVLMDLWKNSIGRTDQYSTPLEKLQRQQEVADWNRSRADAAYLSGQDPTTRRFNDERREQEAYDRVNAQYKQEWLAKNPPPDPHSPEGRKRVMNYAKLNSVPFAMALRELSTPPDYPRPRTSGPMYGGRE